MRCSLVIWRMSQSCPPHRKTHGPERGGLEIEHQPFRLVEVRHAELLMGARPAFATVQESWDGCGITAVDGLASFDKTEARPACRGDNEEQPMLWRTARASGRIALR